VSRWTTYDEAQKIFRVARHTAGSCSWTHVSFGPIDWLDSRLPQRAISASSPSSRLAAAIWLRARVSMP
jgi:hypothetical protein